MKEILKNKFAVAITTVVASFAFTLGVFKGKEFILHLLQLDNSGDTLVVKEEDLESLVIEDQSKTGESGKPHTVAEIVVEDIDSERDSPEQETAKTEKSAPPIAPAEDEESYPPKEVVYTESVEEAPLQGDLSSDPRSVVFSNSDTVAENDEFVDESDTASFANQSESATPLIDPPTIPNDPPAELPEGEITSDVNVGVGETLQLAAGTTESGTEVDLNSALANTAVEVTPESVAVNVSTTELPVQTAAVAELSSDPSNATERSGVRRSDGRVVIGQRGSGTNNSLYSNALAGSVSGLIGGMSRPAGNSERVQFRPVDSTVSASNGQPANRAGNPVVPNTVTSSIPATGSAATNGTSVSVVPQVPVGVTAPQTPSTSQTGGAHLIVPGGNSVLPGGIGVDAGGVSLKVNVGIAQ